jgi:hypothetical protein
LHVPFDQDVLVAYAELRKLATGLNEDNKANNDGKDILTVPLPYTVNPDTHAVTTFPFPEPSSLTTKNIYQSKDIIQNYAVNTKSEKMIASLIDTQTEINPTIKPLSTPPLRKDIKNRNNPITK